MAERKVIHVEPGGETERLLKLVGDEPISVEFEGVRYRIEREPQDRAMIENYDPAKALAALRRSAGALAGIDAEAFKREIREQRAQDSIGRPA
jgi:hypothetical protein